MSSTMTPTSGLGVQQITVRYFAWLRERVGKSEETIYIPMSVGTVAALLDWLASRGPEYAAAFEQREVIRVAINHAHAKATDSLKGAREVGFFPPITGG
jgi:molybdopterin synthase sulfur carrier subunit